MAKKMCRLYAPFLDVIAFGNDGPRIVSYTKNKCDVIVMDPR